ncbi:hypothetical protein C0992_005590 [Termitomyces sp. T32_za158]|nr:hypothetical protein C0992_005590 [Termitomyces sp. T32_za158]
MSPRLRVSAGTGTILTPITHLVNTTNAFPLVSDRYEGEVVVCIKDCTCPEKDAYDYFEHPERHGMTWSIQARGRFLQHISADDVLFGNTFDRPLKLPWGSEVALQFMSFIDPTLEHDITSQTQPWALSPLISMMPHFVHSRVGLDNHDAPPVALSIQKPTTTIFPPKRPLSDDTSQLHLALRGTSDSRGSLPYGSALSLSSPDLAALNRKPKESRSAISTVKEKLTGKRKDKKKERKGLGLADASQRRAHFARAAHRQEITFGPNDILTTDICYGFLNFSPSLALRLPGGLSFDLMRYWNGQPARFVCCARKPREPGSDEGGSPWGQVFWTVVIEMVEDEEVS